MSPNPARSLAATLATCLVMTGPALAQPGPPPAAPAPPAAAAPAPLAPAEPETSPAADDGGRIELRKPPEEPVVDTHPLSVQTGGLTATEVATKAVASSPTLDARQAEITAADAKVDETVAQFLPRLTLTATYRRLSPVDSSLGGAILGSEQPGGLVVQPCDPNDPGGAQCAVIMGADGTTSPVGATAIEFPTLVNQYSLNARLSLPLSDYVLRLSDSMAASRANRQAATIQRRAETSKIAADARVAYYNWLRAVAGGAVARSSLQHFQSALADARTAFELGSVTKADVLRLEAAVAATELAITETDAMRSVMEVQLATMMDEPVREYQVGEDVMIDPAQVRRPGNLPDLIARANRQRLEYQALQAASRSLRAASDALRVSQYPRLDGFGDLTYANPNPVIFPQRQEWSASWALGLSLSFTVNDALSSRAQAAQLDATRAKLAADRRNLERGVGLEVTAAYYDAKKARVAIETAARGSVAAREAYRVAKDLYRYGRATTTDLIQAESELVQASLKEINAALDYHVAQVKLTHATGDDVTQTP